MKDLKKPKKKDCHKKEEPGVFCGSHDGGFSGSITVAAAVVVVVVVVVVAVTGGESEEGEQVAYIYF
jgi:hypothetical protein